VRPPERCPEGTRLCDCRDPRSRMRSVPMSRRVRTLLLAGLTAAATATAMWLATAAQAGIQGSGH